ncbi:MAG: hypothetical protein QOH96_711, partial [Blastocatellia bacterium]|nr:hypothetical protein [Blastocatellia bacterium]
MNGEKWQARKISKSIRAPARSLPFPPSPFPLPLLFLGGVMLSNDNFECTVAIVGSGFSGTLVATHLLT